MRRLLLAASAFALLAGAAHAQGVVPGPGTGGTGSGTVTSVTCGGGLTGGTFTTTGTCAVTNPSPSPSVVGDLLSFSNVTGALQDSGQLLSGLPTISGTPVAGHCPQWASATALGDSGAACGGSGSGASLTAPNTWTPNGAASTAAELFTGTLFTGGSATTTFPYIYINQGATAPTTFSTGGTEIGVNAASGFAGNFLDFRVNGAASVLVVGQGGNITASGNLLTGGGGQLGWNTRASITSSAAGHINVNGSAPAVSACGTSTIDGNAHDTAGTITFAGTPSTCTITFAVAYTTFAHCTLSFPTAITGVGYSYTKTAITITAGSLTGSADYRCDGT